MGEEKEERRKNERMQERKKKEPGVRGEAGGIAFGSSRW